MIICQELFSNSLLIAVSPAYDLYVHFMLLRIALFGSEKAFCFTLDHKKYEISFEINILNEWWRMKKKLLHAACDDVRKIHFAWTFQNCQKLVPEFYFFVDFVLSFSIWIARHWNVFTVWYLSTLESQSSIQKSWKEDLQH